MIQLGTTNRTAGMIPAKYKPVAMLFDSIIWVCSNIDRNCIMLATVSRYSSIPLSTTTRPQLERPAKQQLPTTPHSHRIETPHRLCTAMEPGCPVTSWQRSQTEYQQQRLSPTGLRLSPTGLCLSPSSTPKLLSLAFRRLPSQWQCCSA